MLTDTTQRYTVIISAALDANSSAVNLANTEDLAHRLRHYDVTQGQGCYKGVCEDSFILQLGLAATLKDVIKLGVVDFKQECVLVIDHLDNDASLYWGVNLREHIGTCLHEVPEAQAKEQDAYSCFDGKYYIVA